MRRKRFKKLITTLSVASVVATFAFSQTVLAESQSLDPSVSVVQKPQRPALEALAKQSLVQRTGKAKLGDPKLTPHALRNSAPPSERAKVKPVEVDAPPAP